MSKRNHRYLDRIEPRNVVVRASFELQSHASLCHAVRIGSWNGSFALNLIYIRAVYRPVLDPIGYVLLPYSSRFEETAILTRNDPRDRDLVGKEGEEEWNRNSNSRSGFRAFRPDKTARYKWARILRRNKQPFDTARLIRIAPWGGEPRWDKEREKETVARTFLKRFLKRGNRDSTRALNAPIILLHRRMRGKVGEGRSLLFQRRAYKSCSDAKARRYIRRDYG